ncbi:MAG: thiamine pyrophosphate-binding protein [Acidimicrobiia bacterium]|nr:thiamine pyrophosphate-binding protein [Acidimicrobiia bacterium]
MALMTGGEAVVRTLEALGVTHVFGIVSVHNLPISDALGRSDTITVIRSRHEQQAAHAADGYARATGRLGVVLTSTGPGAANAVAGLFEAQYGSSPVLMITGQTESRFYGKGKGFLHEAEKQLDMLRSVTRRAESVRRPEDIVGSLLAVAADCRTGRPQPGALEIPIDYQYAVAEHPVPEAAVAPAPRAVPDPDALAQAVELLDAAERPLIWAGGGVVSADASTQLTELADKLGAPVVTTIEGRGALAEDHPLCLGARTERGALAPVVADADVVLAVGTRFQNYATRMWQLRMPGKLIHLDADPSVIGRNYPATVSLVADAREGLAALAAAVSPRGADAAYVDSARAALAADNEALAGEIGPDHLQICATMRRLLPRDGIIARDSTVPVYLWGNRLLPILEPRTSLRPSSVSIGPGLSLGIGACAGTGRRTVVMAGDGGFQLGIGELATVAEHNLPMVVCVFNDRGYGVLRVIQDAVMGKRANVDLHTPDFAAVARGMGLAAERVAGVAEFETAFGRAVERDGPTLLDIDMEALAPISFPLPPHQRRR